MSVELIDNIIQTTVLIVCLIISVRYTGRSRSRSAMMLSCYYGLMLVAQLYYTVYVAVMGDTPIFYVSELSWLASWMFMFMLVRTIMTHEEQRCRPKECRLFVIVCVALTVLFCVHGSILYTLLSDAIVGAFGYFAIKGYIVNSKRGGDPRRKEFFFAVFLNAAVEFALWTASCFWISDGWNNPYFWFDFLFSASFFHILYALLRLEKADRGSEATTKEALS